MITFLMGMYITQWDFWQRFEIIFCFLLIWLLDIKYKHPNQRGKFRQHQKQLKQRSEILLWSFVKLTGFNFSMYSEGMRNYYLKKGFSCTHMYTVRLEGTDKPVIQSTEKDFILCQIQNYTLDIQPVAASCSVYAHYFNTAYKAFKFI